MSSDGDYEGEMLWKRTINNAAIEDLLAGNGTDPALAGFVADAHSVASGPAPPPSGVLASMLAPDISTSSAPATPSIEEVGAEPRRRRMPIPAALASMSLFAKLALGVGVAAAATTGAGAAGVLPVSAQNVVANVVETVTPFTMDHGQTTFSKNVTTDAQDDTPGVDGAKVSADAKANGANPDTGVPTTLPAQAANGVTNAADGAANAADGAANASENGASNGANGATASAGGAGNGANGEDTPPASIPPVSTPTNPRASR
jgi:hypothetical protein